MGDEEIDLDAERRQYIDAMFARLGSISHYEALGVARSADRKELSRAYFRLVGIVHPDRYFGKKLGSYKPKLLAVFSRITEAHETLSDAERRKAYDATLPEAPPAAPPVDPVKAAKQQEAMAALKARFIEGAGKAKSHADRAARARAAGDIVAAVEAYGAAVALAPNDPVLQTAYAETKKLAADKLASSHATKAELAERLGKWEQAAEAWKTVVDARPDDLAAHGRLQAALARVTKR